MGRSGWEAGCRRLAVALSGWEAGCRRLAVGRSGWEAGCRRLAVGRSGWEAGGSPQAGLAAAPAPVAAPLTASSFLAPVAPSMVVNCKCVISCTSSFMKATGH